MPFQRYVETGRVAYIADGPYRGKLCSIVDVINQTRVLVDGPETGVPRQAMRLTQLHLTKFRIKFPYTAPTRLVRKSWTSAKINEKWKETLWAKKIANKLKRAELTDYDRFKLNHARSVRNKVRTSFFNHLKRTYLKTKKEKVKQKSDGSKKTAKVKKAQPKK